MRIMRRREGSTAPSEEKMPRTTSRSNGRMKATPICKVAASRHCPPLPLPPPLPCAPPQPLLSPPPQVHVALGASPNLYTLLLGLIASIDQHSAGDGVCVFMFTSTVHRTASQHFFDCVASRAENVTLFAREFDESSWSPDLRSMGSETRPELLDPYNWFRWYIRPADLDHSATRFIYLDSDTIVRSSLVPLYETSLDPHHFAAGVMNRFEDIGMFLCAAASRCQANLIRTAKRCERRSAPRFHAHPTDMHMCM